MPAAPARVQLKGLPEGSDQAEGVAEGLARSATDAEVQGWDTGFPEEADSPTQGCVHSRRGHGPYEVEHADLQVQMQKLQDQLAQIQHRLHTLNESSADEA